MLLTQTKIASLLCAELAEIKRAGGSKVRVQSDRVFLAPAEMVIGEAKAPVITAFY